MIGALWTGISGLAAQQTALDNESHNIANVNTVGYKSSRISFADQMYQDKIGKGAKILDAEKIYTQGNLKVTGVSYDIALSGQGFFALAEANATGSAEIFYSRAGNFRMGDDGTFQDAAGNRVQGWGMRTIDTAKDVTSTNPNTSFFNSDYTKLVTSKVIRHSNYVETIAAKATDYTLTSKTDDETTYTGDGYKTKASKISDVEELIKSYAATVQSLSEDPDGASATSQSQISYVDFVDQGTSTTLTSQGHEAYVYIDSVKYGVSFDTDYETTMKKLADKISAIPGFVAHLTSAATPPVEGTSTAIADLGILKIESLIPGKAFTITEAATASSSTTTEAAATSGAFFTANNVANITGSGIGAVQSARDALSTVMSGAQSDVYASGAANELGTLDATAAFTYDANFFDKSTGTILPIVQVVIPATNAGTVAAMAAYMNTLAVTAGDDFREKFIAQDVNGKLVITPLAATGDDIEFSGTLTKTASTVGAEVGVREKSASLSGRRGAGAELMEIVTNIDQSASRGDLQLRLDTLGISDSAFGEFSIDTTGLITMKQDGADFAIGQVAVAMFNNNRGLNPAGNNLLQKTNESGEAIYNLNNAKAATVEGGTLELSEADLSESLVNLMVFQRAFEANAKSITSADELLNTLINLKR